MGIEERVRELIQTALAGLVSEGTLPSAVLGADFAVERPKRPEHGDLATNVALAIQKPAQRPPKVIAALVQERLAAAPGVRAVEIAGPGFLNVALAPEPFHAILAEVLAAGRGYGRAPAATGERVLVEFVSANPTGPLLISHARGAILGDAVATLLEATGHRVVREYYVNDFGNQVRLLGESVRALCEGRARARGRLRRGLRPGARRVGERPRRGGPRRRGSLGAGAPLRDAHARRRARVDGAARHQAHAARAGGRLRRVDERGGPPPRGPRRRRARRPAGPRGAGGARRRALLPQRERGRRQGPRRPASATGPSPTSPATSPTTPTSSRAGSTGSSTCGAPTTTATWRACAARWARSASPADRFEVLLYQLVFLLRGGEPVKMGKRLGNIITIEEVVEEIDEAAGREGRRRRRAALLLPLAARRHDGRIRHRGRQEELARQPGLLPADGLRPRLLPPAPRARGLPRAGGRRRPGRAHPPGRAGPWRRGSGASPPWCARPRRCGSRTGSCSTCRSCRRTSRATSRGSRTTRCCRRRSRRPSRAGRRAGTGRRPAPGSPGCRPSTRCTGRASACSGSPRWIGWIGFEGPSRTCGGPDRRRGDRGMKGARDAIDASAVRNLDEIQEDDPEHAAFPRRRAGARVAGRRLRRLRGGAAAALAAAGQGRQQRSARRSGGARPARAPRLHRRATAWART